MFQIGAETAAARTFAPALQINLRNVRNVSRLCTRLLFIVHRSAFIFRINPTISSLYVTRHTTPT
jgi:hypothetical protein